VIRARKHKCIKKPVRMKAKVQVRVRSRRYMYDASTIGAATALRMWCMCIHSTTVWCMCIHSTTVWCMCIHSTTVWCMCTRH
jgi:hypothetical protein